MLYVKILLIYQRIYCLNSCFTNLSFSKEPVGFKIFLYLCSWLKLRWSVRIAWSDPDLGKRSSSLLFKWVARRCTLYSVPRAWFRWQWWMVLSASWYLHYLCCYSVSLPSTRALVLPPNLRTRTLIALYTNIDHTPFFLKNISRSISKLFGGFLFIVFKI